MTSSESEAQAQKSRKRSRKSNGGEDGAAGGKKTRGRPRVDTQDATAADVSGHFPPQPRIALNYVRCGLIKETVDSFS